MTKGTYPTRASEIAGSQYEGRDDFFYAFRLKKDDNGTVHLSVTGDDPLIVNKKEVRDQIAEEQGVFLPLRAELSKKNIPDDVRKAWPKIDWDAMYTGASGAFVHIEDARGDDRLFLLQNSLDKPVNPGRWNTASGLISSRRPDETAFLEATEETGILAVDGSRLVGRVMTMSDTLPGITNEFRQQAIGENYALKRNQEKNIQARLADHHPQHAGKEIVWQSFTSQSVNKDVCQGTVVSMMGRDYKLVAHVVSDSKAMSVNIHFPVLAARGFDCVAVDPEKFGRNAGLFTLDEAANLDMIPAPRDYVDKLTARRDRKPTISVG